MTETDELAAALDDAARRWPGLSRTELLVRLALTGYRASGAAEGARVERYRAAVRAHSGALTGTYQKHHRDALRDEWPE